MNADLRAVQKASTKARAKWWRDLTAAQALPEILMFLERDSRTWAEEQSREIARKKKHHDQSRNGH